MKLDTVEGYWASELGETVEILEIGWEQYPAEYSLLINGQACYTDRSLDGIERWLSVYHVIKGSN